MNDTKDILKPAGNETEVLPTRVGMVRTARLCASGGRSSPHPRGDGPNSLERLIQLLVANHTPEELALGYLRYEAVRKMSPYTFGELYKRNLSGPFFDSLVDETLQSWKWPNDPAQQRPDNGNPSATKGNQ